MEIDKSKLTFMGSMNYIVQVFSSDDDPETVIVDQYQPRRNKVWHGEMTKDEVRPQIEETIERMKIAITQFQEYLDGKRTHVYYWEEENEVHTE
jgi:hypothetical protein